MSSITQNMTEAGRPAVERRMGRRARLLLGLAIAAVGLFISAACTADHLLLGANHDAVNPGVARRRLVKVGGRSVECWVDDSPAARTGEPSATVLFFPGQNDRADRWTSLVANAWGKLPVQVWGMNYPGSGGSAGPVNVDLVVPTAVGIFDEIRGQSENSKPIFIQAGSFGTAIALAVTVRRPVAGLVLQNPPPLRQLILQRYGWWNLWLVAGPVAARVPPELDSLANSRRVAVPAVFVLGDSDEIVPPYYQHLVAEGYAGPKRLVVNKGGRHSSPLTSEAAAELPKARDWLWSAAMPTKQP